MGNAVEVRSLDTFADVPREIVDAAAGITLREGHRNPHLGLLLKAFRQVNGGISQIKLAAGDIEGVDGQVTTTHAQIAMLEQGNSVKGAQPNTLELVSRASGISVESLTQMNGLDIADRAPAPVADEDGGEGDGSESAPAPATTKSSTKKHSSSKSAAPKDAPAPQDTPAPVAL